jgi:hypothetical protein
VSGGCYYIRFHFQFHTYIIAISFLTCTDCNTPTTIDRTHVGTWTMWRRRACHQYNHPGKNSLLRNHAFYCPKLDANLRGIVRSPQGLPQRPAHFSVRYDFFFANLVPILDRTFFRRSRRTVISGRAQSSTGWLGQHFSFRLCDLSDSRYFRVHVAHRKP